MNPALLPLALMLLQVGPNPTGGGLPDVPEELRNRPPRDTVIAEPSSPSAAPQLTKCLEMAGTNPQAALDRAQALRDNAEYPLELAQSAHCLGLALSGLSRFDEARRSFEAGALEVPAGQTGYRLRLMALAGNAALAGANPAIAEPIFATAVSQARIVGEAPLLAGLLADHARALVLLDRTDEAAATLTEARSAAPDSATVRLLSATLARRMDKLAEAQLHIAEAARLDPRDPAIGLEAGVIAALAGQDVQARRSFESVIVLAPGSEEAVRAKAYLAQLPQ